RSRRHRRGSHTLAGPHGAGRRHRRSATGRHAAARGRRERKAHYALHRLRGHHRGASREGPIDPVREPRVPIPRLTWVRFAGVVRDFATCEIGWRTRGRFGLLIALLIAFNALNVLNSYVSRDFMTAIANPEPVEFARWA